MADLQPIAQQAQERRAGLVLILAAGLALWLANGAWANAYHHALAFPTDSALVDAAKTGTLAGSLLSALAGLMLLRTAPDSAPADLAADLEDADDIFSAESAS